MANDRLKPRIRLRLARKEDCRKLWYWRNEREVRRLSFNPRRIPYKVHRVWFQTVMNSPRTRILMASNGKGSPFGQVRFEIRGNRVGELHIVVKRSARNRGLGFALLRSACKYGAVKLRLKKIIGRVLSTNARSVRLFQKAGFRKAAVQHGKGNSAYLMTLEGRYS